MSYIIPAMIIPEILCPAGNMEHLETACLYGADAVYLGVRGKTNLRAGARNFAIEELPGAVGYAHERGVRVYLTLNTYPHDAQMEELPPIIEQAAGSGVDALIVADLGVLSLVRELAPEMAVHLSTQANTVNSRAVRAWAELGVSRIILARELSCEEIRTIRANTTAELEIFVHGGVCVSISGRCLISNYLCGRDANQGQCAQPCRWDYALMERTRQGEYMPVEEHEGYTFLYNSRDLCLLPVMDRVMALGLDGLKIEGRSRTSLYIATVLRVYRKARDAYRENPGAYTVRPEWLEELGKVSNRRYFTGFFLGAPPETGINYEFSGYEHTHHLAAKVLESKGSVTVFEARNPLIEGMQAELLASDGSMREFVLKGMRVDGQHKVRIRPGEVFEIPTGFIALKGELVRKPPVEGEKVVLKEAGA
ncbi:MAG: peptidase U32 family protein [Desulfomonilia bacterium]|jgi:putative protease